MSITTGYSLKISYSYDILVPDMVETAARLHLRDFASGPDAYRNAFKEISRLDLPDAVDSLRTILAEPTHTEWEKYVQTALFSNSRRLLLPDDPANPGHRDTVGLSLTLLDTYVDTWAQHAIDVHRVRSTRAHILSGLITWLGYDDEVDSRVVQAIRWSVSNEPAAKVMDNVLIALGGHLTHHPDLYASTVLAISQEYTDASRSSLALPSFAAIAKKYCDRTNNGWLAQSLADGFASIISSAPDADASSNSLQLTVDILTDTTESNADHSEFDEYIRALTEKKDRSPHRESYMQLAVLLKETGKHKATPYFSDFRSEIRTITRLPEFTRIIRYMLENEQDFAYPLAFILAALPVHELPAPLRDRYNKPMPILYGSITPTNWTISEGCAELEPNLLDGIKADKYTATNQHGTAIIKRVGEKRLFTLEDTLLENASGDQFIMPAGMWYDSSDKAYLRATQTVDARSKWLHPQVTWMPDRTRHPSYPIALQDVSTHISHSLVKQPLAPSIFNRSSTILHLRGYMPEKRQIPGRIRHDAIGLINTAHGEALKDSNAIILHPLVSHHVNHMRSASRRDGHEHASVIGYRLSIPIILSTYKSQKSIAQMYADNDWDIATEMRLDANTRKKIEQTEQLIMFHTHPDDSTLKPIQVSVPTLSNYYIPTTWEESQPIRDFSLNHFSADDLRINATEPHFAHMLLSTPLRSLFISPTDTLNESTHKSQQAYLNWYEERIMLLGEIAKLAFFNLSDEYLYPPEEDLDENFSRFVNEEIELRHHLPTFEHVVRAREELFLEYCQIHGLMAFASSSPNNPELHRLV